MTDQPTQQIIQPEQIAGVPLQHDAALIPRTPQFNLPDLAEHPSSWDLLAHAATLSRMVANTEFVPEKFRNRPAAVAGAFLLGHELGLGPMAALRGLYVTKEGDILMPAQTMRAVVRKAGHRIWPGDHTSTRCTWFGMRRDDPDHEYHVTWTIDDARSAKLIRERSAWLTQPRAMLSARASSELCRILAEDALAGVPFSAEEVEDQAPGTGTDEPDLTGPEPAAGTQRRTRKPAPSTSITAASAPAGPNLALLVPGDDAPALDPVPPVPPVEEARVADRSPVQLLAIACRNAELPRTEVCSAISEGRTTSARELTDQEATAALDHVRAIQRGEEVIAHRRDGPPFFEPAAPPPPPRDGAAQR